MNVGLNLWNKNLEKYKIKEGNGVINLDISTKDGKKVHFMIKYRTDDDLKTEIINEFPIKGMYDDGRFAYLIRKDKHLELVDYVGESV